MAKSVKQKMEKNNKEEYSFILFIVRDGENSDRARKNLEQLCEKWIPGKYNIQVVDVLEDFQTALDYNVLLTPSIVVTHPKPQIVIHGDLSDPQKFVDALNFEKRNEDDG